MDQQEEFSKEAGQRLLGVVGQRIKVATEKQRFEIAGEYLARAVGVITEARKQPGHEEFIETYKEIAEVCRKAMPLATWCRKLGAAAGNDKNAGTYQTAIDLLAPVMAEGEENQKVVLNTLVQEADGCVDRNGKDVLRSLLSSFFKGSAVKAQNDLLVKLVSPVFGAQLVSGNSRDPELCALRQESLRKVLEENAGRRSSILALAQQMLGRDSYSFHAAAYRALCALTSVCDNYDERILPLARKGTIRGVPTYVSAGANKCIAFIEGKSSPSVPRDGKPVPEALVLG